jgi:hypothetical protein
VVSFYFFVLSNLIYEVEPFLQDMSKEIVILRGNANPLRQVIKARKVSFV